MAQYTKFVGLDVHKDSIAIAVCDSKTEEVRFYGTIPNTEAAIVNLAKKLSEDPDRLSFVYEAGPCGYVLHRQLTAAGYECRVIAPSLIPKKSGDRVKTDRRDALMLARLHRAGELTPVCVPGSEQETMRDLSRLREDLKAQERHLKQRLSAFLLRHGKILPPKDDEMEASLLVLDRGTCLSPSDPSDRALGVWGRRQGDRPAHCRHRSPDRPGTGNLFAGSRGPGAHDPPGRGYDHGLYPRGRAGRSLPVRNRPSVHGLSGAGSLGGLQREKHPAGRDHEDRKRTRLACPGGSRLELSLSRPKERTHPGAERGTASRNL